MICDFTDFYEDFFYAYWLERCLHISDYDKNALTGWIGVVRGTKLRFILSNLKDRKKANINNARIVASVTVTAEKWLLFLFCPFFFVVGQIYGIGQYFILNPSSLHSWCLWIQVIFFFLIFVNVYGYKRVPTVWGITSIHNCIIYGSYFVKTELTVTWYKLNLIGLWKSDKKLYYFPAFS